jgi:hypothetical protein
MSKTNLMMKVISTVALSSTLFFSGGMKSHAESTSLEKIQGAYYYVNGVEYKVPEDQISNFVDGNKITKLPYDPIQSTPTTTKDLKFNNTKRSKIGTNIVQCIEGYEFDASRYSAGFQLGKSGDRVINQTTRDLTEVSELSSSTTISGSVSGSGTWNWGVIEAEVGFEIGGSYTWSTSQSTTITVPPGYWGWIDYGTQSETWKGYYYYLTGSCSQSGKTYLTVKGPKYKAKLAKTERYPY